MNNILCFYTNADQLRNKLNEFERRIEELKPHIIAINEVKPKNPKCNVTIPEFSIKGYTMFTKNIESSEGRGIVMYTINTLQAEQINILTTFKECLFIDVKLKIKTKLPFGCLYRSNGGTQENNTELLNMIGSVSKLKYTHIVLTTKSENPNNIPLNSSNASGTTLCSNMLKNQLEEEGQISQIS